MNETTTRLLIFSAGCLAGLATSFAILKRRFDTLLAEEIAEEKKRCEDATEMLKRQIDELTNSDEQETEPKPFLHHSKIKELSKKANKDQIISDLDRMASERHTIDIPEDLAEELGIEEDTIYPITADEYGENGYEQERLYYYAADETLTDKDDQVVDADETNVGEDAIDIFIYTDADACYIRNSETKTDYEIIKVDGSYASQNSEGLYE